MPKALLIIERWLGLRTHLETIVFKGAPPISPGEFIILAALEMIMATLDDVLAKVAEETTIEQSLGTLLDGVVAERDALKAQVLELQAELAAAGQDTTKVQAILDAIDSNESLLNTSRRKLMDAVTTVTEPAAPAGGDSVAAPAGDDTVAAPAGDDSVAAATGEDTVAGAAGDDAIQGADTQTA